MSSLAHATVKILNKILGKYLNPRGIPVWGSVVRVASGDYRMIWVDDDGKLVISSIAAPVDVSDRWARQLGKVDIERVLGSTLSATNPVFVGQPDARNLLATTFASKNAVVNPSFEYGLSGWIVVPNSDTEIIETGAHWGSKCVRLGNPGGGVERGGIFQFFSPPLDTTMYNRLEYRRFFWKYDGAYQYVEVHRYYTDGTVQDGSQGKAAAGWSIDLLNTTSGKLLYCLGFRARDVNDDNIYLDDIMVRAPSLMDILDRPTRELGQVWQAEKDRTISSIDDVAYVAGGIVNGDFETGNLLGWYLQGSATNILINTNPTYVYNGLYSLEINDDGNYLWQFFSPAIEVDAVTLFNMMVQVYTAIGNLTITVYYTDGTSQASTQGVAVAWTVFTPYLTSGKKIAAIRLEVIGTTLAYIDQVKMAIYDHRIVDALGYKDATGFQGQYNVAAGNYRDYVDYSGKAKLKHLICGADHSDCVIWLGLDDYWHTLVTDEDISFADLNAIGGEDNLFKIVEYNVAGVCKAILKKPLTVGYYLYFSLYNPTAAAHNVWAGGEYVPLS